jgi:hypothetical protein
MNLTNWRNALQIQIDTTEDNMDEVLEYMNGPFMMASIESFQNNLRYLEKSDLTDDAAALLERVRDMFNIEFGEFLK